jgi:hypothetical protein
MLVTVVTLTLTLSPVAAFGQETSAGGGVPSSDTASMVGGGPAATKGLSPAMIGAIAAGAVVVGVGAALIADSTATDDNVQYPTAHH